MSLRLKIEAGLPYKTRDGDLVTLRITEKGTFSFLESSWPYIGSNGHYYDLVGHWDKFGRPNELDLVAYGHEDVPAEETMACIIKRSEESIGFKGMLLMPFILIKRFLKLDTKEKVSGFSSQHQD